MDHRVQVVQGGEWDVGLVERELGVPPLPIPPVLAPVLTIDGQVEPDDSDAKHSARYGVARSTRSAAVAEAHLVAREQGQVAAGGAAPSRAPGGALSSVLRGRCGRRAHRLGHHVPPRTE
jgi:hypothetical protein